MVTKTTTKARSATPVTVIAEAEVDGTRDASYEEFLAGKVVEARPVGFELRPEEIHPALFIFQRDIVLWALRRGRAAIFADTGLGKTLMQLEWARYIAWRMEKPVLILTPLAVAQQTAREAREKLDMEVTVCRKQDDVRLGVNVTNYEMLAHFDPSAFAGVVLDESSVLKNYVGKTKQALVEVFAATPYKLACTATPAPNDHVELGNHSEFLGIMPSSEMLTRWFVNDSSNARNLRLKGHAARDFWAWVSSWAVALRRPSDLGTQYSDAGYVLPPLEIRHEVVEVDRTIGRADGQLFRTPELSATTMHREMRLTAAERSARLAEIVNASTETWAVWCNTNYEADELKRRIPGAIEVRGSESVAEKERKLRAFTDGEARVIITKPSLAGFGLNWQHCAHAAFVGLSYSFEEFYQAVRRCYRFGQQQPVEVVVVAAETEGAVREAIETKMAEHEKMVAAMTAAGGKLGRSEDLRLRRTETFTAEHGRDWTLYLGDCVAVSRTLPEASVDFSVFSPPFSSLYSYSDALEDMGNCDDDDEFFHHFDFLIPELLRITRPGRLCAVHCKNLPMYKSRYGVSGIRDFRGEVIRHFAAAGWVFHSEVTIWTDPVFEMQRTKAQGLLYKQVRQDAAFSRQGMAEYLVMFRKWPHGEADAALMEPVVHDTADFPLETWQRYASPVWFDVNRTDVLNAEMCRENADEKHLAPLQLGVIERAVELWSNVGDLVFSPFAGVGSEGVGSLRHGRRFLGIELKESYHRQACEFLRKAEWERAIPTLWDIGDVSA